MKKLLKRFYAAHVKDGDDLKLFVCAVSLIGAAAGMFVYDVVTVIRGTTNASMHFPFIVAIGLAVFGGGTLMVLRHSAASQDSRTRRHQDR